jgi:hypothetical protein
MFFCYSSQLRLFVAGRKTTDKTGKSNMGNKQTVFSEDQLENYAVKIMELFLLLIRTH